MNTQAVIRTALRVGLVAGALGIAWLVLLYATGQNPFGPKRLMSVFVAPVAALVAEWRVRRFFADGPGLGRSLLTGLLAVLVTAMLSGVGMYSIARMVNPELLDKNRREMEQVVRAERANFLKQKGGKEQYERTLQSIAATPQALAMDEFSKKILLGLLFAMPGGIFFRK